MTFVRKFMKVVHGLQNFWGYLKRWSNMWVSTLDNKEILTPILTIQVGQNIQIFHGEQTILLVPPQYHIINNLRRV